MKTHEEWFASLEPEPRARFAPISRDEIRQIQIDALKHAASICDEKYESTSEDYSNGHANRGVSNCRDAIISEVESLAKQQIP